MVDHKIHLIYPQGHPVDPMVTLLVDFKQQPMKIELSELTNSESPQPMCVFRAKVLWAHEMSDSIHDWCNPVYVSWCTYICLFALLRFVFHFHCVRFVFDEIGIFFKKNYLAALVYCWYARHHHPAEAVAQSSICCCCVPGSTVFTDISCAFDYSSPRHLLWYQTW